MDRLPCLFRYKSVRVGRSREGSSRELDSSGLCGPGTADAYSTSSNNIITNQTMSSPNSRGTRNTDRLACLFLYKSVRVVGFREGSPLGLDSPSLWWANRAENMHNSQIVTSAATDSTMSPPIML